MRFWNGGFFRGSEGVAEGNYWNRNKNYDIKQKPIFFFGFVTLECYQIQRGKAIS